MYKKAPAGGLLEHASPPPPPPSSSLNMAIASQASPSYNKLLLKSPSMNYLDKRSRIEEHSLFQILVENEEFHHHHSSCCAATLVIEHSAFAFYNGKRIVVRTRDPFEFVPLGRDQ
eukprot:gene11551-biopygen3190